MREPPLPGSAPTPPPPAAEGPAGAARRLPPVVAREVAAAPSGSPRSNGTPRSVQLPDDAQARPVDIDQMARFLPWHLQKYLHTDGARTLPHAETVTGAVLFCDITGFTAFVHKAAETVRVLSNKISDGRSYAAERLNQSFSLIIDVVEQTGGDVFKFAGDALIVVWSEHTHGDADTRTIGLRAIDCALLLQETMQQQNALGSKLESNIELTRLRVGVGVGSLTLSYIGDSKHAECIMTGDAAKLAFQAEARCVPGSVALSEIVAREVGRDALVMSKPPNAGVVIVDKLATPFPHRNPVARPGLSDKVLDKMKSFIAAPVVAKLELSETWMDDLRQVSVAFIKIRTKTSDSTFSNLMMIHRVLCLVNQAVLRFGGFVRQCIVDDKGAVVIAAWGVPPHITEHPEHKALQSALDLKKNATKEGIQLAVGITTGKAFCGIVGTAERGDYSLVGDIVNTAARLMGKASWQEVLCDKATYQLLRSKFSFRTAGTLRVKGKRAFLTVFEAKGFKDSRLQLHFNTSHRLKMPMVGRDAEVSKIEKIVFSREDGDELGPGVALVVVTGAAGIGKSRLMDEVVSHASSVPGLTIFRGAADVMKDGTALSCFKPIFLSIIAPSQGVAEVSSTATPQSTHRSLGMGQSMPNIASVSGTDSPSSQTGTPNPYAMDWSESAPASALASTTDDAMGNHGNAPALETLTNDSLEATLLDLLGANNPHCIYYALLNQFLDLSLPETDETRSLSERGRVDRLIALLMAIFDAACRFLPRWVMLIDDAHDLDQMSQILLREIVQSLSRRGTIILCGRGWDSLTEARLKDRLNDPSVCTTVALEPLKEADVARILAHDLHAQPTEPFLHEVVQRCQGNPLYLHSLIRHCKERRLLQQRDDGTVELAQKAVITIAALGETVQVLLLNRVTSLSPTLQNLLRVASVIGNVVEVGLLWSVLVRLRSESLMEKYQEVLSHLCAIGLTTRIGDEHIAFTDPLLRESLFESLTNQQRYPLHSAVAYELETLHKNNLDPLLPVLGNHWLCAGAVSKAVRYFTRAAEVAPTPDLTINHLTRCMDLVSNSMFVESEPIGPEQQIRWCRLLAEAEYDRGSASGCLHWIKEGLGRAKIDYPPPPLVKLPVFPHSAASSRKTWSFGSLFCMGSPGSDLLLQLAVAHDQEIQAPASDDDETQTPHTQSMELNSVLILSSQPTYTLHSDILRCYLDGARAARSVFDSEMFFRLVDAALHYAEMHYPLSNDLLLAYGHSLIGVGTNPALSDKERQRQKRLLVTLKGRLLETAEAGLVKEGLSGFYLGLGVLETACCNIAEAIAAFETCLETDKMQSYYSAEAAESLAFLHLLEGDLERSSEATERLAEVTRIQALPATTLLVARLGILFEREEYDQVAELIETVPASRLRILPSASKRNVVDGVVSSSDPADLRFRVPIQGFRTLMSLRRAEDETLRTAGVETLDGMADKGPILYPTVLFGLSALAEAFIEALETATYATDAQTQQGQQWRATCEKHAREATELIARSARYLDVFLPRSLLLNGRLEQLLSDDKNLHPSIDAAARAARERGLKGEAALIERRKAEFQRS